MLVGILFLVSTLCLLVISVLFLVLDKNRQTQIDCLYKMIQNKQEQIDCLNNNLQTQIDLIIKQINIIDN